MAEKLVKAAVKSAKEIADEAEVLLGRVSSLPNGSAVPGLVRNLVIEAKDITHFRPLFLSIPVLVFIESSMATSIVLEKLVKVTDIAGLIAVATGFSLSALVYAIPVRQMKARVERRVAANLIVISSLVDRRLSEDIGEAFYAEVEACDSADKAKRV